MAQQLKGELLISEPPSMPAIAVNLSDIAFMSVPLNGKASEIVYVKNVGREVLTISEIVRPETPFSIDEFDLPLTLNPGKKMSFVISVTPKEIGDFAGTIQIESNDPANQICSIGLTVSITEPEDEFAEKRAQMQKRAAKEIEKDEAEGREEIFADWVKPLKENRDSQVKYYMLALLLMVLLVGGIFYKYRKANVQLPNPVQIDRNTSPVEPAPEIKKHLEESDSVKTKKIIRNQPNSYGSSSRKP